MMAKKTQTLRGVVAGMLVVGHALDHALYFQLLSYQQFFFSINQLIVLSIVWDIMMGNYSTISSEECRLSLVVVSDQEFYANLLVINSGGYDVILGMDLVEHFLYND